MESPTSDDDDALLHTFQNFQISSRPSTPYTAPESALLETLKAKWSKWQQLRSQNEKLRDESVNAAISENRRWMDLKKEADIHKRKVGHLRQRVEKAQKEIRQNREEAQHWRHLAETQSKLLQERKKDLEKALAKIEAEYPPLLAKMSKENISLLTKLANHRRYIIQELLSFFPVNPVSETECSIVNIILPNVYTNWKELPPEVLGAALGYLVHMQTVMVSYLDCNLPYVMEYFGSRSKIWRGGSMKKYLLFNSPSNEEDFRIALEMLNWNVIHLAISQGVPIYFEHMDKTLPNLLKALRAPNLGMYGSQTTAHFVETSRRRTRSISSMEMPYAYSSNRAAIPQLSRKVTNPDCKQEEEDDFVVIPTPTVPTPTEDEALAEYEKTLYNN